MSLLSSKKFGKPIQFKNSIRLNSKESSNSNQIGGNALISQFLNLKANYSKDLNKLTGSDLHAKRFFCSSDCAYIFDVEYLRAIVESIDNANLSQDENGKAQGCMILFQGLRKDLIDENDNSKGCAFGRPTIIATAYGQNPKNDLIHLKINSKNLNFLKEDLLDTSYDGIEHPGDGSGGTLPPPFVKSSLNKEIREWVPKVVEKASDEDDTDFNILTTIPHQNIEKW